MVVVGRLGMSLDYRSSFVYLFLHAYNNLINLFAVLQSMIGHCLGAAGGLEAIASVKAITTGWLHPSINQFVSNKPLFLSSIFF